MSRLQPDHTTPPGDPVQENDLSGSTGRIRATEPILQVRDLRTWFYGEQAIARAVDGVNLEIAPGETVGLVGESGCGKSVTSLSIMGLVPSPPGEIQPGSSIRFRSNSGWEELVGASDDRMRAIRGNEIAMIFQEPMTALNPVFTIGRQITEAIRLHRGASRRVANERAADLLDRVGISRPHERLKEYPHQLSGGMRQRVMIAMALACDPKLLIADEPTTALDVTIQAQILDLLNELQEEMGMAILMITHDLGVVAETCDRVMVMYAGQVVEEGPVGPFFERPAHPYSEGLLASIPRLDSPKESLQVIPGSVPSPERWPVGCRFHPRCPHAWASCREGAVEMLDRADERKVRCLLEKEPERRVSMNPNREA